MTRYLVVATNREGRTDHVGRSNTLAGAERFRAAEAAARDGWDVTVMTVESESLEEVVQRWESAA